MCTMGEVIEVQTVQPPALPAQNVQKSAKQAVDDLLPELTPYVDPTAPDLQPLTNDKDTDLQKRLTASQKQHFLDVFSASGGLLGVACKAISIAPQTMRLHLQRDANWLRHLKLAKYSLGENVLSTSYKRALEPSGVIDRMFQLQKRFFPHVYGEVRHQIKIGIGIQLGP